MKADQQGPADALEWHRRQDAHSPWLMLDSCDGEAQPAGMLVPAQAYLHNTSRLAFPPSQPLWEEFLSAGSLPKCLQ